MRITTLQWKVVTFIELGLFGQAARTQRAGFYRIPVIHASRRAGGYLVRACAWQIALPRHVRENFSVGGCSV
jgi:hypothetical protein